LVPVPVREIVVLAEAIVVLAPPPPPAAAETKGVDEDVEAGVGGGRELVETVAFAVTEAGFGATTGLAASAAIAFCLLITHNYLCTSLMLSRVSELLCTKRHPQSSQIYSFKFDTI
jgi:hypothetical protein